MSDIMNCPLGRLHDWVDVPLDHLVRPGLAHTEEVGDLTEASALELDCVDHHLRQDYRNHPRGKCPRCRETVCPHLTQTPRVCPNFG